MTSDLVFTSVIVEQSVILSDSHKCKYNSLYGKCSKISNSFLFPNQLLVIRAGSHKMLVWITNRGNYRLKIRSFTILSFISTTIWKFRSFTVLSYISARWLWYAWMTGLQLQPNHWLCSVTKAFMVWIFVDLFLQETTTVISPLCYWLTMDLTSKVYMIQRLNATWMNRKLENDWNTCPRWLSYPYMVKKIPLKQLGLSIKTFISPELLRLLMKFD